MSKIRIKETGNDLTRILRMEDGRELQVNVVQIPNPHVGGDPITAFSVGADSAIVPLDGLVTMYGDNDMEAYAYTRRSTGDYWQFWISPSRQVPAFVPRCIVQQQFFADRAEYDAWQSDRAESMVEYMGRVNSPWAHH